MNCLVIRPFNITDAALAFVQTCASEIIEALDKKKITYTDFLSEKATRGAVRAFLLSRKHHPTIILGFGHGNTHIFAGQDDEILISCSTDEDHKLFFENFFYLHSCGCGQELGESIVNQGGKGFLGYKGDFCFEPQNVLAFVRAANKGILEMIHNDCTLKKAYELTQTAHDEEIEKSRKNKKFFVNHSLKKNKAILIKHGSDDFVMSSILSD